MTTQIHRYVERIVQQTECSNDEKEDLYEELSIHLQMSQEQFIKDGFSKQEAEKKAIENFGAEGEIGSQIQQAIFPYRKEMLLTLSISSLLFSLSTYLMQLFVEGDAYIPWLLISVAVSTTLLFLSLIPIPKINRKRWMNSILIIHLFTYLWGWSLASSLNHPFSVFLILLVWLIILLSLALIYRTTLFDLQPNGKGLKKETKILHAINITTGIVITGATLFFLWAMLAFSDQLEWHMLIFAIPFSAWVTLYIAQIKLVNSHKRIAFIIASIPALISIAIALYFMWPIFA